MNKWRQRHSDHGKAVKKDTTYGELSDDADVSKAAEDIYAVAASHRSTVIAKEKAAAARKKKAVRRA